MIELYCGLIGSGKTVSAVFRALEYVAKGGTVATNIELQLESCAKLLWAWWRWRLQPGQIILLGEGDMQTIHSRIPAGTPARPVLLVIDEASEWFDALENTRGISDFLSFLRQSRKVAIDCVFITQDVSLIQRRIRALCSGIFWHRNLAGTWASGFGFRLPAWLRVIHVTQFLRDGKTVVRRMARPNEKALWACYKTAELYRDLGVVRGVQTDFRSVVEKGGDDMSNAWKAAVVGGWVLIGVLSVLVLKSAARADASAVSIQAAGASAVSPMSGLGSSSGPSGVPSPLPSYRSVTIRRAFGRFAGSGRDWVCIDGQQYRRGDVHEFGRVVMLGPTWVAFEGDGSNTVLHGVRAPSVVVDSPAPSVSPSSGVGVGL